MDKLFDSNVLESTGTWRRSADPEGAVNAMDGISGPDFLSIDELRLLQLHRLRDSIDNVLQAETVLSRRLRDSGVTSGSAVTSLDDLDRLPFTLKTDLRENYPFGLFARPLNEVSRIHASSGTGGKPTVVGYTKQDLHNWSVLMARSMAMAGIRPGMMVQNAFGYGLFTGGMGFHGGAELLGCTVVPIAGGMTHRQVLLLQDFGAQVLFATPSYALNIAEHIAEAGVALDSLSLKIGIFGAEPWTDVMRTAIEQSLGLKAFDHYGLSEVVGPGVAAECAEGRSGLHIHEDHFLPEIVDPESGEVLPPGSEGELVFTTLMKEAFPVIRYRTRDIATLDYSPCPCGRTTVRMSRVKGRYDDMLIVRGVNIYPSEIERVLLNTQAVAPHYQVILTRPGTLDEVEVTCEPLDEGIDDIERRTLGDRLQLILREETGISMTVTVLQVNSVPRSEGKAVRVIDKRQA